MKVQTYPEVNKVIAAYPPKAQHKLHQLRALILATAKDLQLDTLEETLKWGEPSYLAKHGSTVRMDWKAKQPNQVALYFKCTSRLVPTFKMVFPKTFQYDGHRALYFGLDDNLPELEIMQCMRAALRYHRVKHLPDLGMKAKQ